MSEKSAKKKPKKAGKAAAQPGVLGNLPATRQTRLGRDRPAAAPGPDAVASAAKATAKAPAAKTSKTSTASRPKAKRTSSVSSAPAAASSASVSSPPAPATSTTRPPATPTRRSGPTAAELRATAEAARANADRTRNGRRSGPPSGTEIVTTAVQAAGELAQIGVTVGAQALRRAASRLPRP